jgi:hypothetical protein
VADKKLLKGDIMAVLTTLYPTDINDFFTKYAVNDGLKIISGVTYSSGTSYCYISISWSDGNSRSYQFHASYCSPSTFEYFISIIISRISELQFLNLTYTNFLYYLFYVGFINSNFHVINVKPFSSYFHDYGTINITTDFNIIFHVIANKVDPYEVLNFRCLGYRDGSGLFRVTISDDRTSNNPLTLIQFIKGDTGATGPAGPQGPAGDPGPAGSTPDMSGVIEKLTLISDKLVSIDSNLMAVSTSAINNIALSGVNV